MKTLLLSFAVIAGLTGALRAQAQYGSPDPTYSSFQGGCNAITALEDGSAYVDAVTGAPSLTPYAIARLTPRGELDTSWGTNGLTPFSPPAFIYEFQLLNGKDGDLFVIASGAAAGTIQRLAADGRPDLSFGNAGTLVLPRIASAVLQPDGKIVALLANNGSLLYSFLRFTAGGEPDSTFGHEGALTVPVTVATSGSPGGFGPALLGWAVRSDGGVELAFNTSDFFFVPGQFRLVPKLLVFPGGSLAAANAGARLVPQGIATWISPLAKVEPSGALVLVGAPPVTAPPPPIERFGAASGSHDFNFRVDTVGENLAPHAIWREPDGQWTYVGANLRLDFCGQHCGYIGVGTNNLQAIRYDDNGNFNLPFGSRLFGNAYGRNQGPFFGVPDPLVHTSDGKVLYAGKDCALKRYLTDFPRTETTVVEYYHPALDHYFMTSSANEIALLDNNPLGWIPTGNSFGGWAPGNLPGTVPVCRFYGDPVIGPNSHFYTGEDFECELLLRQDALTPPGLPAWHLEAKPFNMVIPIEGQCPANLAPVYRAYNGPAAGPSGSNHRYTTDPAIYAQMLAKGWLPEGVHFCAPPAIN